MSQPELDLERAYRDHHQLVLRRSRALLADEAEAQEVLQDVFLSLVDRPDQFHGRGAITSFLYGMTTNLCLNRLRNRRRRDRLLDEFPVSDHPGEPEAEAALIASQLLASLPERLARVAVLYHVAGMTHDEIATELGCSRRRVGYLVAELSARTSQR